MILSRLVEFWESVPNSLPPGYANEFLTKEIALDSEGKLLRVIALSGETRAKREGLTLPVPRESPGRSSGVRARLVHDNPEYVLGHVATEVKGRKPEPAKVRQRHEAYVELLRGAFEATQEPSLQAILRWIESGGAAELVETERFEREDYLHVTVDGKSPTDLPSLMSYWGRDAEGKEGYCLVTGEWTTVGGKMPFSISGAGGNPSGTMLVSVNQKSGESYGLQNTQNAPISGPASAAICRALNHLLHEEHHRMKIANTTYVYWCREEKIFDPFTILKEPTSEDVSALLESVAKGRDKSSLDPDRYSVLALSANAARLVIRDYFEATLPHIQRNFGLWFSRLELQGAKHPKMFKLAASLFREAKDVPNHVPIQLMHSALTGAPIPPSILALAVRRNVAEQGPFYRLNNKRFVSEPRMCLIKAVLVQMSQGKINLTYLNENHPDPAYHCGRLLSVLESIQYNAIEGLNATLTDRNFGAACASPGAIFGGLLREAASAHLPKLRKNKPGAHNRLDRQLGEVLSAIGERFPMTLDYQQQGLFALGYYHQRTHNFEQAALAKEGAAARKQLDDPQFDDQTENDIQSESTNL